MDTRKTLTPGDAAVDGLMHGLLAGLLMMAYLVATGWLQSRTFSEILGLFAPGAGTSPLYGGLAHLAVSSIYGAGFALAARWLRGRVWFWAAGLAYGLLLLGVANIVLIPGFAATLSSLDRAHLTIAHLLYGFALGGLAYRGAAS
jgi:hypothetical protein